MVRWAGSVNSDDRESAAVATPLFHVDLRRVLCRVVVMTRL